MWNDPKQARIWWPIWSAGGVRVHTNAAVIHVNRSDCEGTFSDCIALDTDLVITVPTHRSFQLVRDAGLVGPSGWVDVKSETLEARLPGVYAIGDVNIVPMANGRPLPKARVFASDEGEMVGHNIAAKLNGTEAAVSPGIDCFIPYNGTRTGMVQGRFLASGKPDVDVHPPSAEGFRAKEQFERSWRSFRF